MLMDWLVTLYIYATPLIALAIFVQFSILQHHRTPPNTPSLALMSLLDTVWFFVSVAAWIWLDLGDYVLLCAVYAIYSLGSFAIIFTKADIEQDEVIIPSLLIAWGKSFAWAFCALWIILLTKDYLAK